MPSIENLPSTPSLVKAMNDGRRREPTNFNLFDHLLPSYMSIHAKLIPNPKRNLELMPLFMTEHLVVPFHPNGPKSDASKEVPNFNHLAKLKRNSPSKQSLLPVKAASLSVCLSLSLHATCYSYTYVQSTLSPSKCHMIGV